MFSLINFLSMFKDHSSKDWALRVLMVEYYKDYVMMKRNGINPTGIEAYQYLVNVGAIKND